MECRQTMPKQWLILDGRVDQSVLNALHNLPRGSGILVIHRLNGPDQRRIRTIAKLYSYTIAVEERNGASRVHNARELTRALIGRSRLILLSPIFRTTTHPRWDPLPRMRAATLARLCRRDAVALGGMNSDRYSKVAALGFSAWAGISAFRT